MPSFASLTATLILALSLSVSASPVVQIREPLVTLPIARRFNITGARNILKGDQARAKALWNHGMAAVQRKKGGSKAKRDGISVAVTNTVVTYVADVQVGTPPAKFSLLIDTGSSNTWVGAQTPFKPTSSSKDTGEQVTVTYGSGSFSGKEFTDTVSLGKGLDITAQGIGAADTSEGFTDVDGILGVGPVGLTEGTTSGGEPIPTVTDNLFKQGTITENVLGIFFAPTTQESDTNGELTFGGVDTAKTTSDVQFSPITTTEPASEFWGIDQSITFGKDQTILDTTAGIVDTGTTLVLLADDAFQAYQKATGAVEDPTVGLLSITDAQFSSLQSLFFKTAGGTFELTANAQAFPRKLNADIGGSADAVYLIVNTLGTPSGQGLDFINGYTFLERFYSVYDTANKQVGFATTSFTNATTN